MARKKQRSSVSEAEMLEEGIKLRGFFRVNIVNQDGSIAGDTDWIPNTVTINGKSLYLADPLIGGTANPISRMALGGSTGAGGVPATNATALPGELSHSATGDINRISCTRNVSINGSQAIARFLGTFASHATAGSGFCTAATTIGNIMVINSATAGGSIFAGTTFEASALNTNQDVQATYQIIFS